MAKIKIYKKSMYIAITFFFIINFLNFLFSSTPESNFFLRLKSYADVIAFKNKSLVAVYLNSDDARFISLFEKTGIIPDNFLNNPKTSVTVEPIFFPDSKDTYGFLNIYSNNFKFTYPFKKVDLSPVKMDYSLYIENEVTESEVLNFGSTLKISASDKIYIPSTEPLVFNLYFEQTELFGIDYAFLPENNRLFYTGFDYYGFFSILLNEIYPSRFMISNFTRDRIQNLNSNLKFRILKWARTDNSVKPVEVTVIDLSEFKPKNDIKSLPDISYYMSRATLYSKKRLNIPSYNTYLRPSGIFIYDNIYFENSTADLKNSGKITLVALEKMEINRIIMQDNDLSLTNLVYFGRNPSNFYLSADKGEINLVSDETPFIRKNTEISGNIISKNFNKKNLRGELSLNNRLTPVENRVLSISPVMSFFQGEI
ncbi:MAG: hypothetical protein WC337_01315 [Candidatus Muiribacteriota bacterium]